MRQYLLFVLLISPLTYPQNLKTATTPEGRTITYQVLPDGAAVVEGDIVIGLLPPAATQAHTQPTPFSLIRNGDQFRWPSATIPFTIDEDIPTPARVNQAIQYWNDQTPMHLVPRTNEANYVHFIRQQNNGVCFSSIGMIGGEQLIRVDDLCAAGGLIHEIGHSVGLYHEQSRVDRDQFITVRYDLIDKRRIPDYNPVLTAAQPSGPYDYASIMHYQSVTGDTYVPLQAAIETIPPGIPIGQRARLSAGDLEAVNRMYAQPSTATTIDTVPEGLAILVDGETYTSPHSFDWTAGETHQIEVAPTQGAGTTRYQFVRWSDSGDLSHSITTGDPGRIVAIFLRQFQVQTGGNPTIAGSVQLDPPSDDGFYTEGTSVVATATPSDGFVFRSWLGPVTSAHPVSANPAPFRVTSAWNYTANFSVPPLLNLLQTDPPNLRVTIDGNTNTSPWTPAWTVGSTHAIAVPATQTNPSASSRFIFTGWSDGSANAHNVTAGRDETTYTASFTQERSLTVLTDGSGTVNITPTPTGGYLPFGSSVTLTPVPASGFQFVNWIGDLTGTTAEATLTMDTPQRYVTAVFRAANALAFNSTRNAATLQQTGFIAPGEILSLIGTHAAPSSLHEIADLTAGTLPTILGETRVLFDGQPAPLVAVDAQRITVMAPYRLDGAASSNIQIEYRGRLTNAAIPQVVAAVPGVYTADGTGIGAAAATNEHGSPNSPSSPAAAGSIVTLQVTGLGLLQTDSSEFTIAASGDGLPVPRLPVTVSIEGMEAQVVSVSCIAGQPTGIAQVQLRVPDSAQSGLARILVRAGNILSRQDVVLNVQ